MVKWNSLQLGEYNVKFTPIAVNSPKYPTVDNKGKDIKRKYGKAKYLYAETGEEYKGKPFKLIDGEILDNPKLPSTKKVNSNDMQIVTPEIFDDLLSDKVFLCDCTDIEDTLSEGKYFAFDFVLREGLTQYIAVIGMSKSGRVIMKAGKGFQSDVVSAILDQKALPDAQSTKTYIKSKSLLSSKLKPKQILVKQ